ncbi:MAG TPA: hypothetical protein VFR58_17150 [Flavisolibacter sp.]|nr:hypothetical protein [Flavisolibacter sp.]
MRIDIHVHTRKVKSGDAETRNIEPEKFVEILKETDVRILAVTNHNHFDVKQFEALTDGVSGSCLIWPGIELDIIENGKRSHLLIISNPKNYLEFDKKVKSILLHQSPDMFTIPIKEAVEAFDELDCIYVAHYLAKKPNLGDEEIKILAELVSNPKRILKEASNSISAGIYISHGHNSIYGSDIQDWNEYVIISKQLPELRLPVESFEQFCLLLEKDEATINTLLDKKVKENIEIAPFSAAELIRLDIYNDINILFGSKGTGKTEILEALSRYYNGKGHRTSVYKSNDLHLNEACDIKGSKLTVTAAELGLDECVEEIKFIKEAKEEEVISLAKYKLHYSVQETNKISQKLKIKNITNIDEVAPNRKLDEVSYILNNFNSFKSDLENNTKLSEYIDEQTIQELIAALEKVVTTLTTEVEEKFFHYQSIRLFNNIIETFINEIAKKTNHPQKPNKTGFVEYARNRIKIELATKKVLQNINSTIASSKEYIGSLGPKGELYCQTNLMIQNGSFTDGRYYAARKVKKIPQREFANIILSISKHIYQNDLFEKIDTLNQIDSVETIQSISDLLLFYKHFTLKNVVYQPSNGESSMILLHKELKEDKEIYLIDEPEKSLGNDYINDVIVPLLKEKALLGKKVIIATHDANIAVRTLPYNSIYRLHDANRYFTLTGNPFSNTLKCIYGTRPELDWKEISMKTLEGGKEAFGERGKIYGN